jgi:hypothetical protein
MLDTWRPGRVSIALLVSSSLLAGCNPTPGPPNRIQSANPVRAAADLSCSLPVVTTSHIGFVDFPSGRFREDRTAPARHGFGLAYAHGAHRWVETEYTFGYQRLSPDGTEIAQTNITSGQGFTDIYLTNLTTNKVRHIGEVPGGVHVIAFRPDGLYLSNGFFVLRMDPATGNAVQIGPKGAGAATANQGLWFWVTSTAAWYSLIAGPNQGDRNPVLSMSLTDGTLTTWYTAPASRSVSILGFVAPDMPLVAEYNTEPFDRMTGVSFMLLTAPGITQSLNFDPSVAAWGVTDSMGVWLESPGDLWLYDSAGLIPMADVALGSQPLAVAGPCT